MLDWIWNSETNAAEPGPSSPQVPAPDHRPAPPPKKAGTAPTAAASAEEDDEGFQVRGGWAFQDVVRHLGGATALQNLATPDDKQDTSDEAADQRRLEFASDVIRLRNKFSVKRGTLDPRSHVQYWDMVTGLALIFTAFVTPFGAPPPPRPLARGPPAAAAATHLPAPAAN